MNRNMILFTVLLVVLLGVIPLSGISGMADIFAQVDTAWVRRYNGPANDDDRATALAVDSYGNVYVTGQSYGSGTQRDYATIKYYPNGNTAWVRRYNGPGNNNDDVYAVAVDAYGNVYVTGGSIGSGTSFDYATIKYKPNGDTAWARRYNGPANNSDAAVALAVDDSGNVHVTGSSPGSGTSSDYATIKYKPNGDTAWVRRYNGPGNGSDAAGALAVDSSGNVYVTGGSSGSGTNRDYATIKYYPNGDTAWVRRYNGPGDTLDYTQAMATDDYGNVYVTGVSRGTGTDDDYATIKYYPNGDTGWVRRYNGPGNSTDDARAVAVDGSGNVYVTGWSYGSGTYDDYTTIKYYPDGDTAWVRRYNGQGNFNDFAYDMAVDSSGNVYVTGGSRGSSGDEYATIKYYPNGNTAWVRTYNGPGNGGDYAVGITVDGSDNVYATGYSYGGGTNYDYATIKYVQYYLTDTLRVIAFSPVDLIVTDPQGDSIGIDFNTIPGATYDTTQDYNLDGDKDDIVTLPNRLVGDYMIRVIAEPGGGGVYSLGIRIDGSNTVLLSTNHPCPSPGEVDTFFYQVPWYKSGDANGDWQVNSADVAYLINYLFVGGPAPLPWQAGDANCDGIINSADVSYLINYLFIGGPPPQEC
jgi:hypothetical protein